MKPCVYVIEDDENIRNLLGVALESFGYGAVCFETAEEALEQLEAASLGEGKETPALFLLDWMLPGMDGLEMIRRLRKKVGFQKTPILMLTAKERESDVVKGLDAGADDYMKKPFGILELSARVRNLLKRAETDGEAGGRISAGDISIDRGTREVTVCGQPTQVTLKEFELLHYLMEQENRVVSRDELLDRIWGYDYDGETRTLDMHIKTLRQKLGEAGRHIRTIRGVGYRFLRQLED